MRRSSTGTRTIPTRITATATEPSVVRGRAPTGRPPARRRPRARRPAPAASVGRRGSALPLETPGAGTATTGGATLTAARDPGCSEASGISRVPERSAAAGPTRSAVPSVRKMRLLGASTWLTVPSRHVVATAGAGW
jgi:hypothetical protein